MTGGIRTDKGTSDSKGGIAILSFDDKGFVGFAIDFFFKTCQVIYPPGSVLPVTSLTAIRMAVGIKMNDTTVTYFIPAPSIQGDRVNPSNSGRKSERKGTSNGIPSRRLK